MTKTTGNKVHLIKHKTGTERKWVNRVTSTINDSLFLEKHQLQTKPLRRCSLPLTRPKEEKNDHQWPMAAAGATPKAGFTLRREHCISSSWFRVLYTIRETSLVTNYRNDPWKYSLNLHPQAAAESVLAVHFTLRATQLPHHFAIFSSTGKKQKEHLQYSFQMRSLINLFDYFHWKCNLTAFKNQT